MTALFRWDSQRVFDGRKEAFTSSQSIFQTTLP